ncbi:MAG: hypothetical protein WCK70_16935 [Chloroflexales bacterium]|jgi:hypothetical protein
MKHEWVIGVGIALLLAIGGVTLSSPTPGCACDPIDYSAQPMLNALDDQIRAYADTHQGRYPSYAEVTVLYQRLAAAHSIPPMNTPDTAHVWWQLLPQRLTNAVSLATGEFTPVLTTKDDGTVGYAVSADRHTSILVGVEKREHWAALWEPVRTIHPYE